MIKLICLIIISGLVLVAYLNKSIEEEEILLSADQHKLRKTVEVQMKKSRVMNDREATKKVYLTFDDGPSQWTHEILEILHVYDIQATFFMIGSNLDKSELRNAVQRASEAGHYIGAHSMTHDYDILYQKKNFVSEMEQTIELINEITSKSPSLVRAPYGSLPGLRNDEILSQIRSKKMKVWDWTIDTYDWEKDVNEEKILATLQENVHRDTEVVLLHEKEQTLKSLPEIIHFFIEQGYGFEVYQEEHHFPNNFLGDNQL
ncbi:MAG TPA: polysaccharide deacetylase family protein [Candidatus Dormibacteraeota bacterium]|nr:polysaccharide deacetylase family protein [Candidatus Dormibacteraeota bacterium]